MSTSQFADVWRLINHHQGERFHTKLGLPFTYQVQRDTFYPSRTRYAISKSDFRKAYEQLPLDGPGEIRDIVRGPTYVWSVLHDKRILGGD